MNAPKPSLHELRALLDERDRLLKEHQDVGAIDPQKRAAYQEQKGELLGRVARHLARRP